MRGPPGLCLVPPWRVVPVIAFAHRGARTEAPDNSLAAFRRALDLGASGLETDARLAAGEVVLAHDPVLRRGLRRIRVSEQSPEALAALGVPRLAEVYAQLGTGFECSVDCMVPAAARPIIAVARAAGAAERLWLCSPDVDLLVGLRDEAPEVRLVHSPGRDAPPAPAMERHAAELARLGLDAMNLHHTAWSGGLVSLFQRFGLRAFAWDAQEHRQLRAVLRMGVDGIYGDRVDRMVAAIAEWATGG
ncbi:MAG: glycerophosphodiester phosphodiesterase [Actinobacteria bacterium]|nr:glycerophosphodiester phosphodiesterase [Actinomycetota bacterium]